MKWENDTLMNLRNFVVSTQCRLHNVSVLFGDVVIHGTVGLVSSVEHPTCKQGVTSLSPASGTLFLLSLLSWRRGKLVSAGKG